MSSASYIRKPEAFMRPSSPTRHRSSKTNISKASKHALDDLKAREVAILSEIEEVREMGLSIPEDEAASMIADLENQLVKLRKRFKRKLESKNTEMINDKRNTDSLNNKLDSIEKKYKKDISSLRKKVDEAKQALYECEGVIREQEAMITKKKNQVTELEAELENVTNEANHLKGVIRQHKEALRNEQSNSNNSDENIRKLEELACEQEKFIEKLTNDVEKLTKERETFNSRLSFVNTTKRRLKESNVELSRQLREALDMEKELSTKLDEREKMLESMKDEISSKVNDDEEDTFDIDIASDDEDNKDEDVKASKVVSSRMEQLTKICTIFEHREQNSQRIAIKEVTKLKAITEALKKETDRISTLETDLETKKMEFSKLKLNHESIQDQNASSVRAIQRVMAELSDSKDVEIKALTKEVESLKTSNEELKEKVDQLKSSPPDLTLKLPDSLSESEHSSTLVGIAASGLAASIEKINSDKSKDEKDLEIKVLEKEIEQLHKENKEFKNEIKILKSPSNTSNPVTFVGDDTDAALRDANLEIEEMDKELDELHTENAILKKKIKKLEAEKSTPILNSPTSVSTTGETVQHEKRVQELENENEALQKKIALLASGRTNKLDRLSSEIAVISIEKENVRDDDSITADMDVDHSEEINTLKKDLLESTQREKIFAQEVNRLQELLGVPENKQLDSLVFSQDESTFFDNLNDFQEDQNKSNHLVTPKKDDVVDAATGVSVDDAGPEPRKLLAEFSEENNEENKLRKEIWKLKDEILGRNEEMISIKQKMSVLQKTLDNEQNNSVGEKEAILKVLKTKNDALENAKKIIASLQQSQTESLQSLQATLKQKEEEIQSLQSVSVEEKKRVVVLQDEIEVLKSRITWGGTERGLTKATGETQDPISAALNQISFAFHACIEGGDNVVLKNPMQDPKFQSYRAAVKLDRQPSSDSDDSQMSYNALYGRLKTKSSKVKDLEEEIQYLDAALDENTEVIKSLEMKNFNLTKEMDTIFEDRDIKVKELEDQIVLIEKELDEKKMEMELMETGHLRVLNEYEIKINRLERDLESNNSSGGNDMHKEKLDAAIAENESIKKKLAATDDSLRNAKMIISSLEKSNKQMQDAFKTKLNQSSGNLSNLVKDFTEKDKQIASMKLELEEIRISKDTEIQNHENEMKKLRDLTLENACTIAAQEREIRRLKAYMKAQRDRSRDDSSVTSGRSDVSNISQRSDGKRVRRVKRSEKGKHKSSRNKGHGRSIPKSPQKNPNCQIMTSDVDEFEVVTSTSMLLDDDSDTDYDEKKLMTQYMQKNNLQNHGKNQPESKTKDEI